MLSLSQQHIYICQKPRWCEVESPKREAGERQLCHFELEFENLRLLLPWLRWISARPVALYITHVGEWRLSANQTVHFNFHLGRAILRGQRAIWLACKKYYPLSTSYHSGAGEQRPVRNPGSSYQANHWLCNDRCPGKGQGHGDTMQPQNPLNWDRLDCTAEVQINAENEKNVCGSAMVS